MAKQIVQIARMDDEGPSIPTGRTLLRVALGIGGICAALMISGCATQNSAKWREQDEQRQAQFDASLDNWNGQDVSGLIAKAGEPTKTSQLPNGFYLYTWEKNAVVPGFGGDTVTLECTIHFVVNPESHLITSHARTGC